MSDEDARWISYDDLAQARGTTKRAAQVLVRRKKWPRQTNNAGHVLALVPVTWAVVSNSAPPEVETRHSASNGAAHAILVLEHTVEALREAHAGELEALQKAHEAQLATVRFERDQADAAATEARERAERLEAADAARKRSGRWARLRAAWRGE